MKFLPSVAYSHPWHHAPRTASIVCRAYAGPLVVALDYDGVICDTEPELTAVAWRAGKALWPQLMEDCTAIDGGLMDESAYVDRRRLGGQPLRGRGDDGLPRWLAAKMRLLRPLVTSEHEALLLLRLCADEALSGEARKRPLTVGEIATNWGPELCETLCARYRLSEGAARETVEACRAEWRAAVPAADARLARRGGRPRPPTPTRGSARTASTLP